MGHKVLDIREFRHHSPPAPGDEGVSALARVQGGMVNVAQLRAAELDKDAVRRRVLAGLLHDAGRGVYAVGYPRRDDEARAWRAALMYEGAALSRTSAAWRHGVWKDLGRVHLSSMTRRRSTEVAELHRATSTEINVIRGLPCTTLAQTFLDCAATTGITAMLRRAEEMRTFDLRPILPLLDGRRGSPALRAALHLHRSQLDYNHSELERRFGTLVLGAQVPEPLWSIFVEGFWVDAYWPDQRVVVELDGGTHRTRTQQDKDTRRNAVLTAKGYVPIRFTWAQVTTDPAHVLRTLEAVL